MPKLLLKSLGSKISDTVSVAEKAQNRLSQASAIQGPYLIISFALFKTYTGIIRYTSTRDATRILIVLAAGSGLMALISATICPCGFSGLSTAAETAPHSVCPNTTISFDFNFSIANSILPNEASADTWPAAQALGVSGVGREGFAHWQA